MRWLACVVLIACAERAPSVVTRTVELRATTPRGEPVAQLRAWLDGTLLGETQSDGTLRSILRGRPGQRLSLSWACPATHQPPTEQRAIVLDAESVPAPVPAEKPAVLKLEARCTALEVQAALVVRASGAPREGLAVRVRDEVVARTDQDGLAHVLLRARRGSALTVALDTSAHPRLLPASPVETFQLGDDDTILLLDRALATARVKTKRLAARGSKERGRKPFRIE